VDLSLSATKEVVNRNVFSFLTESLSSTDLLPIHGEYKLWIYRNYVISLWRFHLCMDAITNHTKKLRSTVARYLKKWLQLLYLG